MTAPSTTPATLSMVMPMAGRGSRFSRNGVTMPKPLIELAGRPFFWWATESVRRVVPVAEMVFVVLEEHVRDFGIDARVCEHYPDARIVALPEVTAGAAETAMLGLAAVKGQGPVAVNDCDHAFRADALAGMAGALGTGGLAAGLLGFRSYSPSYSYAELDGGGRVIGTVEKRVVSPYAIAGCYLFANPDAFLSRYEAYKAECPYDELFVSGLYNRILAEGGAVDIAVAQEHLSFGTPEELARIDQAALSAGPVGWLHSR